jgi:hypothetical protein
MNVVSNQRKKVTHKKHTLQLIHEFGGNVQNRKGRKGGRPLTSDGKK